MQVGNWWELRVNRNGIFRAYFGKYFDRMLLCSDVSSQQQRKSVWTQTRGKWRAEEERF